MPSLADPRRFSARKLEHPLTALIADAVSADGTHRDALLGALRKSLTAELTRGSEKAIREALATQPDARHFRVLWDQLVQAVESSAEDASEIVLRSVSFPLVLVAASAQRQMIRGTLSDVSALQDLLMRCGALGALRSFGFSNALCAFESLAALGPHAIFCSSRELSAERLNGQLPPAEIPVEPGREQAHLRFIVGAGITASHQPFVAETGANIGAWGMQCSKLLGKQLAIAGVQLLVLPRRPAGLLRAPYAGREAQLDVALNLFVSNTVRRFRMAAGDPAAILSTHDDAELRLTLSSPFAPDLGEGFRWPLTHWDNLDELQKHIGRLLSDVRIGDVRILPEVLPALRASGAAWYPRVDEWDQLSGARLRH